VVFAGRADRQIKIRGFRIEPGDIEAALQRLDGVHQSLVMPWTDDAGTVRLAAYVVSAAPLASQTLRTELAASLPDYMVPASFIALEAMPLTPNGKIDHSALPQPDVQHEVAAHYVAPRNETEAALAAVWAEAFGLEQVGIEDNYFDLGGDSIRSIRLLGKARDVGLDIQLTDLFRYQTIAALAPHVTVGQESHSSLAPFALISDRIRAMLPTDVVDAYPLSSLQAGMLYHSELEPDSAVYLNVNTKVLRTSFDQAKLEAALQVLAQRHPILRTSFHLNGYPQQIQMVHASALIPLQVDDLRHLSASEQESTLHTWLEAEQKRPFDWETAPLLRFHVHRLNDDSFQLTMSEHHAILDGWSEAMIQAELFQLYLASLGESLTTPPVPETKYNEYIAAEQAAIASEAHRHFWTTQVADAPLAQIARWPKEHTPSATNNPAEQNAAQRRHTITLSAEVVRELQVLARESGTHIKHLFLAAHFYLLGLLSGQKEVMTGLVTNGRLEQTDGERALGLFLNAVPLQQQLADGTWTDLIRSIFAAEQAMLPHRRFPLIEIQQLRPGQPLFEAVFNFNHFHVYDALYQLDNFQILTDRYYASTSDTFTVNVMMDPGTAVVELTIEYATDQFTQAQIEAIIGYYAQTLADIAHQPNATYANYSPISATERTLLVETWNQTEADFPADTCPHQFIVEQAARNPNNLAVISDEQTLTYQQLVSRANQLAHHLRSLGVGPETIVGINVGRDTNLIVGLLGILNAGGAYLPLDPDYPEDRLAFMIEDAQTPVVISTAEFAQKLPDNDATIVKIDADWPTIAQQPTTLPDSGVTTDNLAYIIYTSGSTGKPKGVLVSHKAMINHNWYMKDFCHITANDRMLQFTTINFDVAIEEIFPTLISGAGLVISPTNMLAPSDMNDLANRHQVTLMSLPTAYWQLWARELKQMALELPPTLRFIMVGGEAMIPSVVAIWYELDKDGRTTLVNVYGPTEATVTATVYTLQPSDAKSSNIPIGYPMSNYTTYVLDERRQPVPIGVPGELYIGGVSVARGYLRRPGRTAQAFLPDPFANDPEAIMYKTGDQARWLPDGNIEFIGRTDFQVKVRGYRIELGEIETALLKAPDVHECLVTVHETNNRDKQIVAYVLAAQNANLANLKPQALEAFLLKNLPEYMVPSAFMRLDAWPLTPNGKINRRALPTNFEVGSDREIVAPRTEIEATLVTIWQELLGVAQVSVHDNFFKLGGHSLKAMQLVSRLRDAFDVALPLRLIFEASTVADMATAVTSLQHITKTPQVTEYPDDDDFEEGEI
ncbi:MAG: amino acid adenylation domain-containing protein, partial [Anaerolineales bacterium]|nr:amino acid adenylation domain-containing protein [Anaerolineales bacterium]